MPFKNPHPLYSVWQGMRRRCRNPRAKQFDDYGGRGISICSEWDDFHRFVADMGERPEGFSLDRIDNEKGYYPENCRWASRLEQQRNQRTTRRVIIEGKSYLVAQLASISGLKHDTIIARATKGMGYEDVIRKTRYTFTGGVRRAIEVRVANQKAKTNCKHGHQWTPENTGQQKNGGRYCKACHRLKVSRQNARKRAALSERQ